MFTRHYEYKEKNNAKSNQNKNLLNIFSFVI